MLKILIRLLFFTPAIIYSQYYSDKPSNILIFGQGNTQITSEIGAYEQLTPNVPIKGVIMITHDQKNKIDPESFRMGKKKLKAELVQSTPISPSNQLEVTIYNFEIEGMPAGAHTLPPISVKVGGEEQQALPLSIIVDDYVFPR